MKYENFSQVKELVEQINSTNNMLSNLKGYFVSMELRSPTMYFLKVDASPENEQEVCKLAAKFKDELIAFYEDKLSKLTSELEAL
jgi:hypothetical protein